MRVALVTCRELPEPDPDESLLLRALAKSGVDARLLAWDDPQASACDFELCVLRSCWNYYVDPEAFLRWIDAASGATELRNPAPVVRWNLHKRYLLELADQGVSIIPTALVARGSAPSLEEITSGHGRGDVVVKPAVSAASYRTRLFRREESADAARFLADLARERDVLVQAYVPSVERSLVWIDGVFTHAVEKAPRFGGDVERIAGVGSLSNDELDLGASLLALVPHELSYARVDVMRDSSGDLLLSELELIEPSLYLAQSPEALRRLTNAIATSTRPC